ncbi:MAG TPA: hypothetical protein VMF61_04545 [Candidatus Acidoferrales bacterium]|nr:hypothetical protein [Candidatus Acidoferrales bacterium]
MSFLARWLGWQKPNPRAGLRPHREIELDAGFDDAYDRVLSAIDRVLGAHVSIDDRRSGFIEAAFGLVNNERLRCTFEAVTPARTSVRVEAFFPAGATVRETSLAVETLAGALEGKDA